MSVSISGMGGVVSHQDKKIVKAFQRPSVLQDIKIVGEDMRQSDIEELQAQSGGKPKESLLFCFFASTPCMTIVSRHGNPIGMWGVVPQGDIYGRIWMLGCDAMLQDSSDKRTFLKESKIELKKLHNKYPVLGNIVDARNSVHIRWLHWMGFTFINKLSDWGPESRPFYEFVRI